MIGEEETAPSCARGGLGGDEEQFLPQFLSSMVLQPLCCVMGRSLPHLRSVSLMHRDPCAALLTMGAALQGY